MVLKLKMFHTITPASDGSVIPRYTVEEYLNSDTYRNSIESGSILCSVSHRDRALTASPNGDKLKGVVGKDDNLLLNKSAVGKITKIFLPDDPQDEWVYGICELFDENLMDKESAENIKQIKGLIRNGVKVSTSSVVISFWNQNEVCEKIVSIRGNDFTLNPAFSMGGKEPAGVIGILEDDRRD